jgi:methionyl-tRNA synthetase
MNEQETNVPATPAPVAPAPVPPAVPVPPAKIEYDDFAKVDVTVGKILEAEKIVTADKLLRLVVDFAEGKPRQIVSGIAMHFPDPSALVGKKCMFVTNLKPRTIKGYVSDGMIFAVSTDDGKFSLLEPSSDIPEGTTAA